MRLQSGSLLDKHIANNVEVFRIVSSVNLVSEWVVDVVELGEDEVSKCSVGKAGVIESLQFLFESLNSDYESIANASGRIDKFNFLSNFGTFAGIS